ncbi:MAG: glucan biosynthesis protein [Rhodobacteraceae bacterium]|jgi:periplasmic glucans biosynthesis protein|nr:glucan biosynthesis protein [Paracoccaceae bacterium]
MTMVTRRETLSLLSALAALAARPGLAQDAVEERVGMTLGQPLPFDPGMVQVKARVLASKPYVPGAVVPQEWVDLTYDQFQEIWFDTRHSLWRETDGAAQVEFFPAGLYNPPVVTINAVEDGRFRPVIFELRTFDMTDRFPDLPEEGMGFSGFRLLGELEAKGQFQEYAVFQGATYFRAIGKGQAYGLSARGLALGTGSTAGEEFPVFREFWVEAADPGAPEVVIHALMDSPSVAGAFTFTIRKGDVTEMTVESRLFPRVDLTEVGIAPETSMFLFDQTNRNRFDDFRDAVHDSDGLLMLTGAGETLWRPLANPDTLGFSVFSDTSPRGFGLMQRARNMTDFADLVAHYERRPSLWVEPQGDWGAGAVMLVEIPADKEIYDNIVCFWRPADPLLAGQEYSFSYRLHWCADAPVEGRVARVRNTRTGARIFEEGRLFTVDFEAHPALGDNPDQLVARVSTAAGAITSTVIRQNPATGGMRLDFTLVAPEGTASEMRADLVRNGAPVTETWLYRWMDVA